MIGQINLLNKLNNYTIDTFPRSIILSGAKGCGKHTVVNHIKDNILKLPLLDITENISDEYIDAIYRNPNPSIYLIDTTKFTFDKEQNILLKFIEEPLKNAFIVLLCENRENILNTINNRCITFEFDKYTPIELSSFITDEDNKDLILSVLTTPGQILTTNVKNINDMKDVCEKIAYKLSAANFSNTLTLASKINYKDEYDKFDIDIFFNMLTKILFDKYLKDNDKVTYSMYLLTVNERKKLLDKRLKKDDFMFNFLTRLWKESRKGK